MKADTQSVLEEVTTYVNNHRKQSTCTEEKTARDGEQVSYSSSKPYLHPIPPLSSDTIIIPHASSFKPPPLFNQFSPVPNKLNPFIVVVDRLCGEAVLRGADVFVRGVWSASAGIARDSRVLLLMDLHRDSQRGCLYADYQGEAICIGQGVALVPRTELVTATHGLGIRVTHRMGPQAPPLNGFLPGRLFPQNLPSLLVGHVLAPLPGSTVIDLCACPGGKATHLATLMRGEGVVVACDRSRKKIKALQTLGETMGLLPSLCPLVLDTTHPVLPPSLRHRRHLPSSHPVAVLATAPKNTDGLPLVPGFYPETFDHVLLDPPCSALGLRPRFSLPVRGQDLDAFVAFQRKFWWAAVFLLRVGGSMTYSTCTLNPQENEEMVRYALDTYSVLQLVPAEPRLGAPGGGKALSDEERGKVQLFLPKGGGREGRREEGKEGDLDVSGFFVAKFVKVASVFEGKEGEAKGTAWQDERNDGDSGWKTGGPQGEEEEG
ncbi:hypothetical protein NSK_001756 [Nannochloropsis salina CCMP1776]|uniref:SAM-dependent MTase RsmB/NOP-type domain-containing protein n=1 Tax=Nannochloropsis salina CCMP1776 TaxID=1027361 RepID=A0A4D9D8T7_9STRA|nr:hypothetical protein NSK_001756 [Nannochloropsis salina CCMP1776]|eukprot:TFJ87424.1 hypothetical protein NSK_001756 [Nannochloropsis salina CCMP1776]